MKTSREQLLKALQYVSPGLSPKDVIEQSSCFCFCDGQVITFNGEVSCRYPAGLDPKITGAIHHGELLELLQKRTDDDIEIVFEDSKFIVAGKNWEADIPMEEGLLLPVHQIEKPGKWVKLLDTFPDAIGMVSQCAAGSGNEESQYGTVCVHVHPDYVEAHDNAQVCRWSIKTGLKEPTLVKSKAIKQMVSLGMVDMSDTERWLHFRNASGLVFSITKYLVEDYQELDEVLDVRGDATALPKGLVEASDRANIFSKSNGEANFIKVNLRKGKLTLRAEGVRGAYRETTKVVYSGDPMEFCISPLILADLVKRHSECIITPTKMLVDGGSYKYVVALTPVEEEE